MLILHSRKLIFLRCRKTASTSLEIALSQFAEGADIVTPLCARDESLRSKKGGVAPQNHLHEDGSIRFFNHMKAVDIRELVGHSTWNAYYKFCVDRNPWDKVVSLYYHRNKNEPRAPFGTFISSGEYKDALNYPIYTVNDQVVVDHVARYEDIEGELAKLSERVGLPRLSLPNAKGQFRPVESGYRSAFSDDQRQAVEEYFRMEIDLHGYRF